MRITRRQLLIGSGLLGLLVLVLLSRSCGSSPSGVPTNPAAPTVTVTAEPTATPTVAATSEPPGEDGPAVDPPAGPQPTTNPEVQEAATAFTAAWLNTYGQTAENWRRALYPRVTPDLVQDLTLADPASVPTAGRVVDEGVVVTVEGSLLNADAPIISGVTRKPIGSLRLTLVAAGGGKWLVSEIDWRPRR